MVRIGEGRLHPTAAAPPTILPCRLALDAVLARSTPDDGERFLADLDRFCPPAAAGNPAGNFPVAILNDRQPPAFAMVPLDSPAFFTEFCDVSFRDTGLVMDVRHFPWAQAQRLLAALAKTSLESDVFVVVHHNMMIDAAGHLTGRGYPRAILDGKRYMVDGVRGDRLFAWVKREPRARPLLQRLLEMFAFSATGASALEDGFAPDMLQKDGMRGLRPMFLSAPPWSGTLVEPTTLFRAANFGQSPSRLTGGFDVESSGAWCIGNRGSLTTRLHTGGGLAVICLSGRIADTGYTSMTLQFRIRCVLSGHTETRSFTATSARPHFHIMLPVEVRPDDTVDIEIVSDRVRRPNPDDLDLRPLSFRLENIEVWPGACLALDPRFIAFTLARSSSRKAVAGAAPADGATMPTVLRSTRPAAVAIRGDAGQGLTLATHEGLFAFDRFQTQEGVFLPQARPFAPLSPALREIAPIDWEHESLLLPHGTAQGAPVIFDRVAVRNHRIPGGGSVQLAFVGFNEPESEGVWTAEETAYLLVSQPPGETQGVEVRFDIVTAPETMFGRSVMFLQSAPQIEVAANGQCIVGPIVMNGPGVAAPVSVTVDAMTPSAVFRISSPVATPAMLGLGEDRRSLGMFLTNLRVQSVRPAVAMTAGGASLQ